MIRVAIALVIILTATAIAWGQDPAPGTRLERGFRRLDANGDGRLSREEASPRLRPLFGGMDADGDGFVTVEEARAHFDGRRREASKAGPEELAMKVLLDFPYSRMEGVDPNLLSLDLYAPPSGEGHPVLVMIHGGGWRRGDKSGAANGAKSRFFVGEGYVFVSINYRLSPAALHPAHVTDVAKALAWVHGHVAEYGGDPGSIFVMGHSAGAHLAALVATDERYLKEQGKSLAILDGVVLLDSAAYDLVRCVDEFGGGRRGTLYERAFGKDRDVWRDASPMTHVAEGKSIPPFLVFHTGARVAGATLSREFVEALVKAGAPARAVHAADRDHAGINRCIGRPGDPYTRQVMRFLADPKAVAEDGG